MTAINIVDSRKMQEDASHRNSPQMKVRTIDSYSDSKSMSQLGEDKMKRCKESSHVLCTHLQLKNADVYQTFSLLNDTE